MEEIAKGTVACAACRERSPGSSSTTRNASDRRAREAGPDEPSALHSHFNAVAAMSPVQYQKRLRLQDARRLLRSGASSAELIAYKVGYASAPQFGREYARLLGQPPRRDAERVRDSAATG